MSLLEKLSFVLHLYEQSRLLIVWGIDGLWIHAFRVLWHVLLCKYIELIPVCASDIDHLGDAKVLVQHVVGCARPRAAHDHDGRCWLVGERRGLSLEVIATPSSQPPSRRGAMASSPRPSVVTTLRFRSSPSLAAFWRLGGSFAIISL